MSARCSGLFTQRSSRSRRCSLGSCMVRRSLGSRCRNQCCLRLRLRLRLTQTTTQMVTATATAGSTAQPRQWRYPRSSRTLPGMRCHQLQQEQQRHRRVSTAVCCVRGCLDRSAPTATAQTRVPPGSQGRVGAEVLAVSRRIARVGREVVPLEDAVGAGHAAGSQTQRTSSDRTSPTAKNTLTLAAETMRCRHLCPTVVESTIVLHSQRRGHD